MFHEAPSKPENTSIARASAFNRANVEEFLNNYALVQATCNFSPDRIWNTDETGITTVLQAPRVIAETGSKAVGQCVSAERGSLVTMCGIISAVGASIPPLYIFPRVRMEDQFFHGAVPGAVGYAEKSGWMSTRVFLKLLEHIKKHTNSSPTNQILLLMDNHETHVSLDAISFAREHGIVLLSFPPHCTHKMQPLDKGVYGPFKSKCKISFNDFILSNPGKPITIYDVAKLSAQPYSQTFTPCNIISSFNSTGLRPINSLVYKDEDFCASFALDRPLEKKESSTKIVNTSIVVQPNSNDEIQFSTKNHEVEDIVRDVLNIIIYESTKSKINILSIVSIVKPSDVKPLPKACPRNTTRKSRKGKSRIYTSTPEIERIEELEKAKLMNVKKTNTSRKLVSESKPKKMQSSKQSKRRKKNKAVSDDILSSDPDINLTFIATKKIKNDLSDSDMDLDYSADDDELNELLDDEKILRDDYLLVKFATKKRSLHYVGKVIDVMENGEFEVTFLKKCIKGFVHPEVEDISYIERKDIVSKLPKPMTTPGTSRMASFLQFDVNFFGYDVK
ncbi:hypothetical protein JTB14_004775 [Gonioctena quinquepunctata]|nr:hypothetical protein JTB14_004775 [Gonioctena quinquepunctata]